MFKKLIITAACTLLASCASGHYLSSHADRYGTFVLRTASTAKPHVEIVIDGTSYSLPAQSIAAPYSKATPAQRYRVEAGKELQMNFTYHWSGEEVNYPRSHSNASAEFVSIEKSKRLESCSTSVSFLVEEAVRYDIYVKLSIEKCASWVKPNSVKPKAANR